MNKLKMKPEQEELILNLCSLYQVKKEETLFLLSYGYKMREIESILSEYDDKIKFCCERLLSITKNQN